MLVLGIRFGKRIFVGDVAISLEQISGGVRLGFEAPPEVQIERESVRNKRLRITNHIPAATLPPEYRQERTP
jgi:sRNA-binding carbon storage regulator CsrA